MTTTTEPKLDDGVLTQWPPLVHILDRGVEAKPGAVALCGSKIMGIKFDPSTHVDKLCAKCEEIAKVLA